MKIIKKVATVAILTIFAINSANAQSISDIFGSLSSGSSSTGDIIGNVLEGVFSSSNISVADMTGTWRASGPAVCFQSDSFLKKAGGIAAAAAIEEKIKPYYQKYGLNNATLTVDNAGNFSLATGKLTLKGTITPKSGADAGVFEFNFTVLNSIKLGSVTTYVQKTSQSMDVMFDATKLKKLLTGLTKYIKIDLLKSIGSILDSYEGLCIGFKFNAAGGQNQNSSIGSGLGGLLNVLGGNSATSTSGTTTNQNTAKSSTSTEGTSTTKSGTSSSSTKSGSTGFSSNRKGNSGNSTNTENSSSTTSSSSSSSKTEEIIGTGIDLLKGVLNRTTK